MADRAALLGPDDPPPVEEISGAAPLLLVCDHASHRVPAALDGLGLPPARLLDHIGWDIGAANVTRRLARALDAPAVLCGYSRLVVDCNRHPGDATAIAAVSDGVVIPGNQAVSAAAAAARRAAIFEPYHAAISRRLAAMRAGGAEPSVIAIHSFTPTMNGVVRPWHVGVLWDDDPRLAVPLMAALGREAGLCVGDNQPYSARDPVGYTVEHHAQAKGVAHVALELRQDLIAVDSGAAEWAERLARLLTPLVQNPGRPA